MKFSNAVKLLESGKSIKRKNWGVKEYISKFGFNCHGYLSIEDWNADDWDIVDDECLTALIEAYEGWQLKTPFDKFVEKIQKDV